MKYFEHNELETLETILAAIHDLPFHYLAPGAYADVKGYYSALGALGRFYGFSVSDIIAHIESDFESTVHLNAIFENLLDRFHKPTIDYIYNLFPYSEGHSGEERYSLIEKQLISAIENQKFLNRFITHPINKYDEQQTINNLLASLECLPTKELARGTLCSRGEYTLFGALAKFHGVPYCYLEPHCSSLVYPSNGCFEEKPEFDEFISQFDRKTMKSIERFCHIKLYGKKSKKRRFKLLYQDLRNAFNNLDFLQLNKQDIGLIKP
jgi:hypothetical protein